MDDRADDIRVAGRALVATGRHVVASGGPRPTGSGSMELLADARTWSIP